MDPGSRPGLRAVSPETPASAPGLPGVTAEALESYFGRALRLARRSYEDGSYPVGAVIVSADGRVIGSGFNRTQARQSPIHHAEIEAMERARRHLVAAAPGSVLLVTTGEPCLMCLGAILNAPAIGSLAWALGPVSPAGSALAAVRASGYNAARVDGLQVLAQPSPAARRASCELLYRWCIERADPRAAYFAGVCGPAG